MAMKEKPLRIHKASVPRRRFMNGVLVLGGAGLLSGCSIIEKIASWFEPKPVPTDTPRSLIDVHCHTFNVTDLPAIRFIRRVLLSDFAKDREIGPRSGVEDLDFIDALIGLFRLILVPGAPSAITELRRLSSRGSIGRSVPDDPDIEEQSVEILADYLNDRGFRSLRLGSQSRAEEAVRELIILEAGEPISVDEIGRSLGDNTKSIARRAILGGGFIGRHILWLGLFRRSRSKLIDRLFRFHARQNFTPVMIAPALVDFSRWLQESPKSSIREQCDLMGYISARKDGPVVHGYVPFDPLHEVMYQESSDAVREEKALEPVLDIVSDALNDLGFIGVKLYPPMGFRPSGNRLERHWPEHATDAVGDDIGQKLDDALARLYALCVSKGAPIIAHAANSNAAGAGYGGRADPAYWVDVFETYPDLRVCLSHSGSFWDKSITPVGPNRPANSWEWVAGEYIQNFRTLNPNQEAPIFLDLSYFSEILSDDAATKAVYAEYLKAFVSKFDPECRHILFGSDWSMLAREKRQGSFTTYLASFLKVDCGFNDQQLNRIFIENALDFLGLREGATARLRLTEFYVRHDLNLDRLPKSSG